VLAILQDVLAECVPEVAEFLLESLGNASAQAGAGADPYAQFCKL